MRLPIAAAIVFLSFTWMGCSSPSAPRGPEAPPPTLLETVQVLPQERAAVALRADNGKFVCADFGREGLLVADRAAKGEWETFFLIPQDSGRYAIMASSEKYVSADRDRAGALIADRTEVGEWELFELHPLGDGVFSLHSSEGKVVSTALGEQGADHGVLFANRDSVDAWEKFTLLRERAPADQP